jgi:hypothetical protein
LENASSPVAMRTSDVGVGDGVRVGRSVADGVTPGGRVGLGSTVDVNAGPTVHPVRDTIRNNLINIRLTIM